MGGQHRCLLLEEVLAMLQTPYGILLDWEHFFKMYRNIAACSHLMMKLLLLVMCVCMCVYIMSMHWFHAVAAECGDPGTPAMGSRMLTGTTQGNTVDYGCQLAGYVLRGNSRRTCQESGRWSGNLPVCESKSSIRCSDVVAILNLLAV